MLRDLVKRKIRRALEAADLSMRLTKDLRSRAALLSCYAGITRDPNDASEVSFQLCLFDLAFPVTMRKCDIFTLSGIFFDRDYAIQTPLPRNPVVIDCGANIGLSAIWFLGRWPGARVHAFEPEPRNFRFLELNCGARSDVAVTQAAVGKARGAVRLHVAVHGALHSIKDPSAGSRAIEVPCLTLADYLRESAVDCVDVLKLDVEGSELDVLMGLGDQLDRVDVIVGQLHEKLVDEHEFYRYTDARGFRRVKRERAREGDVHLFELARA